MSKRSEEMSPRLPVKSRLLMAAFSAAARISCRSDYTINRSFMKLIEPKAPPSSKPINGVSSFDIPIDSTRNLWFRLYIPATATSPDSTLPLVIYFHGGGFCFFSTDSKQFDQHCRRIALQIPAAVVSVNYRLAPEHKYPSQYDDGFDALKFIDGMSFDFFDDFSPAKLDLRRCFVAGDSAGGNVAHHVAVKAVNYSFSNLKVIGVVAIQPFFGGEERTDSEMLFDGVPGLSVERSDWYWKAFLPEGADRDHETVNVFGPNATDMTGVDFPATLICIGGCDILQDWQKRYYEGLKKCGIEVHFLEYPKMVHGFYVIGELDESSLLIQEMREFIEKTSGKLV